MHPFRSTRTLVTTGVMVTLLAAACGGEATASERPSASTTEAATKSSVAGPTTMSTFRGRMWVRTRDAFVAIDPQTNTVTDTLATADVGPDAHRTSAIDDTVWACDGRRLHRYELDTMEPTAVIDLAIECDFVHQSAGLVVVWTYDDAPGESGSSAAAMIDPDTNQVLATVDLPVDVLFPAVLDDVVFFAGNLNATAVTIDRATWAVSSPIALPRVTGGGGVATDGRSIFVPTHDEQAAGLLVIDAATLDVVDTIQPLEVNAVLVDDGSLWVTHQHMTVPQRFDLPR